jgi:hypothetical protein
MMVDRMMGKSNMKMLRAGKFTVNTAWIQSIFLIMVFVVLGACSDTASVNLHLYNVPGTDRFINHHNFSEEQVAALQASLAKLKFPQPAGTVNRLLPVHVSAGYGKTVAGVLPNEQGLLSIHDYYFNLSVDYILHIRRAHYIDRSAKPVRFFSIDEAAEVIQRSKLPKNHQRGQHQRGQRFTIDFAEEPLF